MEEIPGLDVPSSAVATISGSSDVVMSVRDWYNRMLYTPSHTPLEWTSSPLLGTYF